MSKRVNYKIAWCAQWIATGFGVGDLPVAPGTFGTVLGLLIFLPLQSIPFPYYLLFLVALFGIGVYTANLSEPLLGVKDSPRIVIDEIGAILLVLIFLPASWRWWLAGFILFRVFDIIKPPPIRQVENLPGGWGVMADDCIAALYSILVLRLVYVFISSRLVS